MPLYNLQAGQAGPILASGFYTTWGGANVPGESGAIADGVLYFLRFPVNRACTLDRIGLEITVAAASSVVRLGIYGDTNGAPGTLILDAGTIDSTGTGFKEITISQAITPGVIWLCAVPQGASTVKWRMSDNGDYGGACDNSGSTLSIYSRASFSASSISGALPSTHSGGDANGASAVRPRIIVRVA